MDAPSMAGANNRARVLDVYAGFGIWAIGRPGGYWPPERQPALRLQAGNPQTVGELIEAIRNAALTESGKGDRFE